MLGVLVWLLAFNSLYALRSARLLKCRLVRAASEESPLPTDLMIYMLLTRAADSPSHHEEPPPHPIPITNTRQDDQITDLYHLSVGVGLGQMSCQRRLMRGYRRNRINEQSRSDQLIVLP